MACSSPPEVYLVAAPQARSDDDRVGVLVELPGVVNDAGEHALVVGLIVGDANPLGKKARIVGKVECAG